MATLRLRLPTALSSGCTRWLTKLGEPQVVSARPLCEPVRPKFRPGVLAALLAICLIPRMWMAAALPTICPDAIIYFRAAAAIERGDLAGAMAEMKLNTLPLVLAGLHRLGLDYETAGMTWGLFISTIAVLPLFGWARRQFDDRVAIVTALIYAFHPGLIERSPEILREPTFWFLFLLGLYASWRAAAEGLWRMYALAGGCLILAVLTRFEGALLVVPLVGWSAAKIWSGETRGRSFAGLALALGIGPAILLVGSVVAPESGITRVVRLDPLARFNSWVESFAEPEEHNFAAEEFRGRRLRPGILGMCREYSLVVGRGIEPVVVLFLLSSLVGWTGLWVRRDILPLLMMAVAVLLATWIHLWFAHEGSSRYVLTALLSLAPLAALGILWPKERRELLAGRLAARPFAQGLTAAALLFAFAIYGCADAVTSNFDTRSAQAELGRWLARHYGAKLDIAGSARVSILVAYYSQGDFRELWVSMSPEQIADTFTYSSPDVVLASEHDLELCATLARDHARWKLEHVDRRFFPEHYNDRVQLYIRQPLAIESGARLATNR